MKTDAEPGLTRVRYLDGLRGLACLAVIHFHFWSAFYPSLVDPRRAGLGLWLSDTPLGWLWNGRFAVMIFFVLSGFVIAVSSPRAITALAVKIPLRYFRLAVPATASCLLAWGLLSLFPDSAGQVARLSGSTWLSWTYQAPIPQLYHAVIDGLFGVFVNGTSLFNNALWTLRQELLGSIFVYAIYASTHARSRAVVLLAAATVLGIFLREWGLAAFMLGAVAFEMNGALKLRAYSALTVLFLSMTIGSASPGVVGRLNLTLVPDVLAFGTSDGPLPAVCAFFILCSVLGNTTLRRFLEWAPLLRLGSLSFPLYLCHVPIICTLSCYFCLAMSWGFPLRPDALSLLFAVTLTSTFVAAIILYILVEEPTLICLRLAKSLGRISNDHNKRAENVTT